MPPLYFPHISWNRPVATDALRNSASLPLEPAVPPTAEAARKKPRTQTRQYVNSLIQQDWEDINQRLDKAIQEAKELLEARADIEMLAKFSGIDLV